MVFRLPTLPWQLPSHIRIVLREKKKKLLNGTISYFGEAWLRSLKKYLHKGDLVYIEGKLRTRSWEKEGVTRYTTEIVADNMTMLGSRSGGASGSSSDYSSRAPERASTENYGGGPGESTDDLPF